MVKLADAGLVGCTVLLDKNKANVMAQRGVRYTNFRPYNTEGPYYLTGQRSDFDIGARWWTGNRASVTLNLDQRVYIQPQNEQNVPMDGWYWLGMQTAAAQDGWKLSIFGDGVGNPADFREFPEHSGKYVSETWKHRVDSGCLAFGKAHGNLACLHQYGRLIMYANGTSKETDDPGSAIWPDGHTDEGAYFWFGGRHKSVYHLLPIPEDSRMLVLVGECGPSDAVYRGSAQVLNDMKGYQTRYGDDPYIAAYTYWTVGGDGGGPRPNGNYHFAYSTLDPSLPDILAWLKSI